MHQNATRQDHPYVRRIPRGNSGKTDLVSRLQRMAEANRNRIRGMERSVVAKEDREALKAARRRLVEILSLAPWAMPTGAYQIIEDTMKEARDVFNRATKPTRHPRRRERQPEAKHFDDARRMNEEDNDDFPRVPTKQRRVDPIAEAFQREIDAAIVNK